MWPRVVWWAFTNASKERSTSISKVALKTEAMSANSNRLHHIPEDSILHSHCRDKLRFHILTRKLAQWHNWANKFLTGNNALWPIKETIPALYQHFIDLQLLPCRVENKFQ
jgi:hypothetical protein